MVLEIVEIYDEQEYPTGNNNIINRNSLKFLDDYKNFKKRLYDHNTVIELLIRKILQLNSLNIIDQNRMLKSRGPNYSRLKDKKKNRSQSEEILLIKKLLHINSRHLKVMQKLYQENDNLQKFVDDSYNYVQEKSFTLNIIQNQDVNSKPDYFKARLQLFLDKIDIISNNILSMRFCAGNTFIYSYCGIIYRTNQLLNTIQEYEDELILWNGNEIFPGTIENNFGNSSQMLSLKNNSNNVFDGLSKVVKLIDLYKEIFHSYDLDVALDRLKFYAIDIEFPNTLLNSFEISTISPCNITNFDSTLHLWPESIEFENNRNLLNINESQCSNTLTFPTFDTFSEEVLSFANICENALIQIERAEERVQQQIILSELENIHKSLLHPINFNNLMHIAVDVSDFQKMNDQLNSEIVHASQLSKNKKKEKIHKKSSKKIRVFYSLHCVHMKLPLKKKNCKTRLDKNLKEDFPNEFHSNSNEEIIHVSECNSNGNMKNQLYSNWNTVLRPVEKTVSVGVGEIPVSLCDGESQIDLTELNEDGKSILDSKISMIEIPLNENTKSEKFISSHNFKQSLKNFKDFIQSCNDSPEPSEKVIKSIRRNGDNKKIENFMVPKMKNFKNNENIKRKSFNLYRQERPQPSKLPEMRKNYQIILQNRMPEGIGLEYIAPSKSKVEVIIMRNLQNTRSRKMHFV